MGAEFAGSIEASFAVTSAMEDTGVKDVFHRIANVINTRFERFDED